MTDLQASLIVIGIIIIVAVVIYNKWQENKERKAVEKAFSSSPDDVLMHSDPAARDAERSSENARREPIFESGSEPEPASVSIDPASNVAEAALAEENDFVAGGMALREIPVDDLIDCIIALLPEAPLRGEKVLPLIQGLRHIGGKPLHYFGEREDGNWEPVAYGGVYATVVASVQVANRAGVLNELEYSELIARLRQIADELGAELEVPDMADVTARARALHEFIAEYDAKLSINLLAQQAPWAMDTLMIALERHGFDLRPDGRLVMPDGDNGILFSLSTNVTMAADSTSRLTLLLDVPCVAPSRDGFGAMVACARSLAARLDGVVVDDAGQALSESALAEIAAQITAFYDSMEQAEIPAGSPRAMRLFH